MRKLSKLFLGFMISYLVSAQANATVITDANSYFESSNLSNYIESKSYTPLELKDDFGQLVSESMVGSYKLANLHQFYRDKICQQVYWFNCNHNVENLAHYTGIDLNTQNSLVDPSISQVNAYKVIYTTANLDHTSVRVSGAVLIPEESQELKGVIIFYHFTALNKNNVPSSFDQDEFKLSKTLAATLASAGYIVLAPDYLGMGVDSAAVHPYVLYPEANALSGIYMLKLLATLQPGLKYRLIKQKVPLLLSGYSEGGAYALWAAKILQDNPHFLEDNGYRLTATVPMAGVYNLSKVTVPFLLANIAAAHTAPYFIQNQRVATFTRPGLIANVLNTFSMIDMHGQESLVIANQFADCHDCTLADRHYRLSEVLTATGNEYEHYKMLYQAATPLGYSENNNSIASLANPQLLTDKQFIQRLQVADIYNWHATTPINLLTLEYDSTVPRLNSETAYAAMLSHGSTEMNITIVPNHNFKVKGYIPLTDTEVDHPQALSFLLLFTRKIFDEKLSDANNN